MIHDRKGNMFLHLYNLYFCYLSHSCALMILVLVRRPWYTLLINWINKHHWGNIHKIWNVHIAVQWIGHIKLWISLALSKDFQAVLDKKIPLYTLDIQTPSYPPIVQRFLWARVYGCCLLIIQGKCPSFQVSTRYFNI